MGSFFEIVKSGNKIWRFIVLLLVSMPALLVFDPALAQERLFDMSLRLVPNRSGLIEVEPGKENLLRLEVNNIGTNALTNIKLSSDTDAGWGISFAPSVIDSLAPASIQTVNVNIIPPPNVVIGEQSLTIVAEPKEIPGGKAENFTLTVRTAVLTMRLLTPRGVPFPTEVRAGQDNALLLEINNIGNKAVTGIRFSSDRTEGWEVRFDPGQLDSLAPGNIRTINVTIKPPAKATKDAVQITLIAEANEARQIETVFLTVKPAQVWIWVWIAAGVVVVAIFVFIYLRFSK